jgi:ribosomal-protein-alanine N-acetyltransferase
MKTYYKTQRLSLHPLTLNDAEFISELVNSPGWIQFIGDRNVRSTEDAAAYIRKLLDNPAIYYWVVKTIDQQTPMGVVTLIQREYLDHPDIGFAFLPRYSGQGYAYEATHSVLTDVLSNPSTENVLATTIKENENSIKLLEKLGLRFNRQITIEDETLLVYSMYADH